MKRIIRRILMGIFLITFVIPAYTSPLPPQGVCSVKAKVLQVSEKTQRTWLGGTEYENDITVKMTVEIQQVLGTIQKAYDQRETCNGQYKNGDKIELTIVRRQREFIDPKKPLHVGDVIVGNIERIGGWPGGAKQPFVGYDMTSIRIDNKQ
ncbi:MAG: hypothetical protein HY209_04300 [Candidatus Omnitrophica bacterium]|nr:hypothetical protein [Candidatus Omnitrophota bacterium]